MEDLIKALTIFLKYANLDYPIYCEHEELRIMGIYPDKISGEDHSKLLAFGFFISEEDGRYKSYRFG